MRTSSKDLLIGIAGIGGLAGFATLLLLYGELTGVVTSRYTVEVAFDSGGGLRKGSPVTLNGVPVQITVQYGAGKTAYTEGVTGFSYVMKNTSKQYLSYNLRIVPSTPGAQAPMVTSETWTAP